MKTSAYIILDRNGIVATRKNKPSLLPGQAMIRLELDLPPDIFEAIVPTVRIKVPDDYIRKPISIKLKDGTMDKLLGKDE